jgi:type IV secretory pathway VirJ component
MQTSQIKLGEDYAVNHGGRVVAMRVFEIISRKRRDKTENTIGGFVDDGDKRTEIEVFPKDVVSTLGEHQQLQAMRKAAEAERLREKAERNTLQRRAIQLLAKAIGAQPVLVRYSHGGKDENYVPWSMDRPAVIVDSENNIEVNAPAWASLVAFLERVNARTAQDEESVSSTGLPVAAVKAQWEREAKERVQAAIDRDNVKHGE